MNEQQFYDKYKRNKQSRQFYTSAVWHKCRELALKRDNYLCQDCLENKQIKRAEMVHHIVEITDDFTKALVLENLRSLCNSCHNKHHDRVNNRIKKMKNKISVVQVERNTEKW